MESGNSNKYEMRKRRETMADNRRYIIYYTFGENSGAEQTETKNEKNAPLTEPVNSDSEAEKSATI